MIEIPWRGDKDDVVLIDVTLEGVNAFAGFTYSPWYLDIPHQEVLFDSNSANIDESEYWKLESTLSDLKDTLDKYGSVVPVKLYIGGCTDTVGDQAHNRDLSMARARAISQWLRSHGYSHPIYYYGFGENLLAVKTGDGVDEVKTDGPSTSCPAIHLLRALEFPMSNGKSCPKGSIQAKFFSGTFQCHFGLLRFMQDVRTYDNGIHVCAHKTEISIFWRIYDGFASHIH